MKNTTKFKIVKWAEKILGYKHLTPQIYKEHHRDIKELRMEREIRAFEYTRFIQGNVAAWVAAEFTKELTKANAIDIKIIEDRINDKYKLKARVFFVTGMDALANER